MQEGDPGDGEGDEGDDAGDGGGDVWAFGWGSLSVQGADLTNIGVGKTCSTPKASPTCW